MPRTTYRLSVNVQIQQLQDGAYYPGAGGLEIREQSDMTADGFFEVAAILGEFHKLTEALKETHAREE